MPTYEYVCQSCGHNLEVKQSMTEDALTHCPKCQKEQLTKVVSSPPPAVFKGRGWTPRHHRR